MFNRTLVKELRDLRATVKVLSTWVDKLQKGSVEANSNKEEQVRIINKRLTVLETRVSEVIRDFSVEVDGVKGKVTHEVVRLEEKVRLLEEGTDEKLFGLSKLFDIKMANLVDEEKKDQALNMMKRIAELEEVKDAKEHRRGTEEILKKKKAAEVLLADLDRKDQPTVAIREQIKVFNWVLGG